MQERLFSAVIAAYEIQEYADALFRSIEKQTIDSDKLEIILVDDGSTDQTLTRAQEWAAKSRFEVTVKTQTNAGVAVARNHGISLCTGEWIAFVDSDDVLDRKYFEALATFIRRDVNQSASLLTSRSVIFNEAKGLAQDNHPLGWKYRRGDRLVSLTREPHVIHLGGHSTIVRTDVVQKHNLRFSSRVKPAFEDAHFIGKYLGTFSEPIIGLVATARYYYRKRANGSSLIDTTWSKSEKFSHEPRYGHLDLLSSLNADLGYVPVWAQNMVLYSLYWYFRADRNLNSPINDVDKELLIQFWETLHLIFELIDESVIRDFKIVNYGWGLKEGILRQFKASSLVNSKQPTAYMWNADDIRRNTRKIGYTFLGDRPQERLLVNGKMCEDYLSKTISHMSFGQVLMYEQVIILPRVNNFALFLDDRQAQIIKPITDNRFEKRFKSAPARLQLASGSYKATASEKVRMARSSSGFQRLVSGVEALWLKIQEESWINGTNRLSTSLRIGTRICKRYAENRTQYGSQDENKRIVESSKTDQTRLLYRDAWIIMDHPQRADDNGEHFYRYLAANHPEINAFFMISENSTDWTRLSSDGFRLVSYNSEEAVRLTLNAKFIISSHIDAGIYDPVSRKKYGPSPARRIFLQHGMVMNDLSQWLNTKGLALMVSSSPFELEHFVGDGSKYKFTEKEVRLTGLPRHDSLVSKLTEPTLSRPFISFVPTWRQGLTNEIKKANSYRAKLAILQNSDFYQNWKTLVSSRHIQNLAEHTNSRIIFVLHDHMADFIDLFDFPEHVELTTFRHLRVQELLVSSRILVTDYSSIATEAAIAGAPVAYFQFDKDSIYGTGHTFSPGWFDYSKNGFGPVFTKAKRVESWIRVRSFFGWRRPEKYIRRLNKTLPILDGSASRRVYEAILELDKPFFE